MKKIPTIFKRDQSNLSRVTPSWNKDCLWVREGEGIPRVKLDGTACLWEDGQLFKRYTLKKGKKAPDGFRAADKEDPVTGKTPGWVPVGDKDKYHKEALSIYTRYDLKPSEGTYELLGPKVQGNPEGHEIHILVKHDLSLILPVHERTYYGIRRLLKDHDIEGIVYHHKDGRKAKIKKRDFGLSRKP